MPDAITDSIGRLLRYVIGLILLVVLSAYLVIKISVRAIPFLILLALAIQYTHQMFSEQYTTQQYQYLLGLIGMAATMAGLSLKMASFSNESTTENGYYKSGRKLVHATILLSVAVGLKFAYTHLQPMFGLSVESIRKVSHFFGYVFFWYATLNLIEAVIELHVAMSRYQKGPIASTIENLKVIKAMIGSYFHDAERSEFDKSNII